MVRLTTEKTWYRVLQITGEDGSTCLHNLVWYGQTQVIKLITEPLTAQHLIHLLRITDEFGRTPLQLAEYHKGQVAAELLRDYQSSY